MAAPTKVALRPVTPAGMGFTDRGQAATDMAVGDLLILASTTPNSGFEKVWQKAPTSTVDPDGIALTDAKQGKGVDVGIIGEIDGFSGMTIGQNLYSSASVVGGLDTSALTEFATTPAVTARVFVKAVSDTRIRFNFV